MDSRSILPGSGKPHVRVFTVVGCDKVMVGGGG